MNYQVNTKEELEEYISKHWNDINKYICDQMRSVDIPFYSSVDIRESKNKIAPVDHNLYPAGFNNLCQLDRDAAGELLTKTINNISNDVKTIGILTESNTKNTFYLDHLIYLSKIFLDEDYEIYFISFDQTLFPEEATTLNLTSYSKFPLTIHKAKLENGIILQQDKKLDLVILNNDQSAPIEIDWKNIQTPVNPSPFAGWNNRQKIKHFEFYKKVADQFADNFSINPNLIQAKFKANHDIDYSNKEGFEQLAKEVDELREEIPEDANIFIKASQGTYGMGISIVKTGEDVLSMNRKTRNKMDIGKNKKKFTSVLIQEGVPSIMSYDGLPSEIAIYLLNGLPIGGFVRANEQKKSDANLNSKGMVFKKYCISEIKENNEAQAKEAVYSVIARLATLASAYEIKELEN